jgi:uncharacterized membrane protein (DUF4010 family)
LVCAASLDRAFRGWCDVMSLLWLPFFVLAGAAVSVGWLWTRQADSGAQTLQPQFEPKNPRELSTALLFAALFLAMLVARQLVVTYLGRAGVNTLAALMGVTDVALFIMGMTQAAGTLTPLKVGVRTLQT